MLGLYGRYFYIVIIEYKTSYNRVRVTENETTHLACLAPPVANSSAECCAWIQYE